MYSVARVSPGTGRAEGGGTPYLPAGLPLTPPWSSPRGVPVAALGPNQADAAVLQGALPCGGLRLLYHPHLPWRADRLHAVQQEPGEQRRGWGSGHSWAQEPAPDAPAPSPHPQNTNFPEPVQQLTQKQVEQMQLKYYNSDVHRAAFVLPEFARKVSGSGGSYGLPSSPAHHVSCNTHNPPWHPPA